VNEPVSTTATQYSSCRRFITADYLRRRAAIRRVRSPRLDQTQVTSTSLVTHIRLRVLRPD
jgi:hypothetical protein